MIRAHNITKNYNKTIIKNFTYEFNRGLYLITGKSGCGKTTLLNILSKKDKKVDGVVQSNENILYVKDKGNLVSELTVKEHIMLFEKANKIRVDYHFKIDNILNKKVKKLSLGERQLITLILVFNSIEKTIILDEPLSALSRDNLVLACKMLEKISIEKTVIISTHNKEYFNNYYEINLDNKNKYTKVACKQLTNNDKCKKFEFYYWLMYIKKNIFKKIFFVCSLIFIVFNFLYLNKYLDKNFSDYLSYFSKEEGTIISRDKNIENIDENKFYEIIKYLSNYVVDYNANYYSTSLYSKEVKVDNYYIDNGMIFSMVKYVEESLNDNEIIMGINYKEFCLNNNISNCDEAYIRTLLINKNIKNFDLEIKNIFNNNENIVFSNKRYFKIYEENEYVEYYFDILKEDRNNMFKIVNNNEYLSNFKFVLIGENTTHLRYRVDVERYFGKEIEYDDYLVCLEKGYNCLNYYKSFETLISVDDVRDIQGLRLKIYKQTLKENQIVISSGLSGLLQKKEGEQIVFNFKYRDEIIQINLTIVDIVEDNNYCIYQNSSWSYKIFSEQIGYDEEDLRVKNIIVFENVKEGYYESENLYKTMLDEIRNLLSNMKQKLFLVNLGLSLVNIAIVIVLEIYQNKFKKEYFEYLKFLNVEIR